MEEVQRIARRVRPNVNGQTVRVEAHALIRTSTSTEHRMVPGSRWREMREWGEDLVQLRVR